MSCTNDPLLTAPATSTSSSSSQPAAERKGRPAKQSSQSPHPVVAIAAALAAGAASAALPQQFGLKLFGKTATSAAMGNLGQAGASIASNMPGGQPTGFNGFFSYTIPRLTFMVAGALTGAVIIQLSFYIPELLSAPLNTRRLRSSQSELSVGGHSDHDKRKKRRKRGSAIAASRENVATSNVLPVNWDNSNNSGWTAFEIWFYSLFRHPTTGAISQTGSSVLRVPSRSEQLQAESRSSSVPQVVTAPIVTSAAGAPGTTSSSSSLRLTVNVANTLLAGTGTPVDPSPSPAGVTDRTEYDPYYESPAAQESSAEATPNQNVSSATNSTLVATGTAGDYDALVDEEKALSPSGIQSSSRLVEDPTTLESEIPMIAGEWPNSSENLAGDDDGGMVEAADFDADEDEDDDYYESDEDDEGDDDEQNEGQVQTVNGVYAEESKSLLSLLYSIAEDQARKEGYVHRSISCNHCGASPIRGFRFKCSNCVDFDLCESCEALNVHYKTHVFVKIRIPIPPLANPRNPLVPVIYPGNELEETANSYDLADLQAKTHFDHVELEAFYEQFRSLSTVDTEEGGINKETFEKCLGPLGLEKNLITERIFAFYDQDGDGIISFEELVCGLSILCKGSLDERIKYAFKGYDLDGDGYISREELRRMFKAYFRLSMELVRDVVRTMEEGMIDNFDDEATKPVSAAFSAPIPNHARSSGSDDNEDEEDHDESGENAKKMKEASAKGKKSANQSEPNGGVLLDAQRTESLDEGALMLLARDHPVPSSTSSSSTSRNPPVKSSARSSSSTPLPPTSSASSQSGQSPSHSPTLASVTLSSPNRPPSVPPPRPRSPNSRPNHPLPISTTGIANVAPSFPSGTGSSFPYTPITSNSSRTIPGTSSSTASPNVPVPAPIGSVTQSTSNSQMASTPTTTGPTVGILRRRTTIAPLHLDPSSPLVHTAVDYVQNIVGPVNISPVRTTAPVLPLPNGDEEQIYTVGASNLHRNGSIDSHRSVRRATSISSIASRRFAHFATVTPLQGTPLPPGQMDEEQWPVMEAMSMEAIEEMVDRTFAAADALDKAKIDFDEFKKVVESDLNLLAWFESLGSVF